MGGKVDLLGSFSTDHKYLEFERTGGIGSWMLDNILIGALEMCNIVDIEYKT